MRKVATRRLQYLVPRSRLSNAVASHAATPSSPHRIIDLGKQIWTQFQPNAISTEAPGACILALPDGMLGQLFALGYK
jgi:hypothetical protein